MTIDRWALARRVASRFVQGITMPPRQLPAFVSKVEKEFAQYAARIKAAKENLDRVAKVGDSSYFGELKKKLGLSFSYWKPAEQFISLTDDRFYYFREGLRQDKLTNPRITDSIATLLVNGLKEAMTSDFKNLVESLSPERVERVLEENEDLRWNEKYEEGLHPDIVTALRVLYGEMNGLLKMLEAALVRLEAFATGDVKPGNIETLYHASLKAREIHQNGFKAEMPKDQLGLGGSQEGRGGEKGISFTYDLKAALEIARSFKEVAMIATGQVSASDVLSWVEHDGDIEKFMNWLPGKLDRDVSVKHDGHRWVVTESTYETGPVEKDIDEVFNTPAKVFQVYDAFLFGHHSRLNPVHLNRHALLTYLKDADPKDIGVVAAEVDMTHPGVDAKTGEREFRVPPAAVIKITRFY